MEAVELLKAGPERSGAGHPAPARPKLSALGYRAKKLIQIALKK